MASAPSVAYRILDPDTAVQYTLEHRELTWPVPASGNLQAREVSDGNLNLVFVVRADPALPGVVLKQALPWVRVHGESWPLSVERARAEARGYEQFSRFAPEFVPAYYGFDPEQYIVAMEDLADLRVWRGALNDGEIHEGAAAAMGTFVARIAFYTSDFGMEAKERKALLAATVNPELCEITEDVVLTEPYIEHEHNRNHPALDELAAEVRNDDALRSAVAELKFRFMTHGEALIHGDLHTGSVMVGGGRALAFDPEFCFYGPVGFDLGVLWANFVIAMVRAEWIGRGRGHASCRTAFKAHVDGLIEECWSAFLVEMHRLWPQRVDRFFTDDFLARYLRTVWSDALGYAGTEAMRRVIGYAHIPDIDALPDSLHAGVAAAVLRLCRRLILERHQIDAPEAITPIVAGELVR